MKDQLKPEGQPPSLLVTIDEAARRLAIGRSHIYEQMQRGRLRSVRIGRSRRILEQDLDDFIVQLLNGSDCSAIAPQQPLRRGPVKNLPSRPGRR